MNTENENSSDVPSGGNLPDTQILPAATEFAGAAFAMGSPWNKNAALPEQTGTWIGRYRLLEKLGEGGFGTVWRAEQQEPIRREVAVKVIRAGMDSAEITARFAAERQALAIMDHPNIAAVLDAGETDNGRPFFVMELVCGKPITVFCDEKNLTVRQRLELFIPVCQAIQHAHQKGILHRDLKPSNILVEEVDGAALPKVIDFGIAKAITTAMERPPGQDSPLTLEGMVIGTPEYMSPEQAGSRADVDTRSDVYSLGAVLYKLLTGRTPLGVNPPAAAGFHEILRRVREVEPPRASDSAKTHAARAGTRAVCDPSSLRGDIDWILLKCLERDRDRRYDSPGMLAEDIRRHLAYEPVMAGPPSTFYRLKKSFRKHRVVFTAAAIAAACVIAGGIVSFRAYLKEHEALDRESAANVVKDRALQASRHARTSAEKLLADTLVGMREDLTHLGKLDLLARPARAAEEYLNGLPPEAQDETTDAATASMLNNLGDIHIAAGAPEAAESCHRRALEIARRLAAAQPASRERRDNLTSTVTKNGDTLAALGRRAEAATLYEEAVALSRLNAKDEPGRPRFKSSLAISLERLGDFMEASGKAGEAEKVWREALSLWEDLLQEDPRKPEWRSGITIIWDRLSALDRRNGDLRSARQWTEKSVDALTHLTEDFPDRLDTMHSLSIAWNALGQLQMGLQLPEEADISYRKAMTIRESLAAKDPGNIRWQRDLYLCWQNMGAVYMARGQPEEAAPHFRKALEAFEKLTARQPEHPRWQNDLLLAMEDMADCYYALNALPDAEALTRKLVEGRRSGATRPQATPKQQRAFITALTKLSRAMMKQEKFAEAEPVLREAVKAGESLCAGGEKDPDNMTALLGANQGLGTSLGLQGPAKAAEAKNCYREALRLFNELEAAGVLTPKSSQYKSKKLLESSIQSLDKPEQKPQN